jgi:hypothetical protein
MFRDTNENFTYLLNNLGLTATFDFSKRNNKKLYTHEFIKTVTEFLKYNTHRDFIFFSNALTKDKFRNQLLSKVRKIFKIRIWEGNYDLEHLEYLIQIRDATIISGLEMMFLNRKPPSFKKISKYLEREGLIFLNEKYFQEVINKMIIFNH